MARNFVFTINYKDEIKEEDDDVAIQPHVDWPDVRYVCYGEEIGENGTHHLQGFVQFLKPKRLTQLKKMNGLDRAHIERMRGTSTQAREYALKIGPHANDKTALRGTEVEWGTFCAGTGARMDVYKLRDSIKEGKTMREIYDNDETLLPAIQYSRGVEKMIEAYRADKVRDFKTHVEVYVGDTGSGKTYKATQENPGYYMKPHTKWWDGYKYEDVVVFDDFYGWYPYHLLLILLDRYECPVEVKGGYIKIAPKKIVITSNKHIHEWYNEEKIKDIRPLLRRVDKYVWFHNGEQKVFEGSDMDDGVPIWYSRFQGSQLVRSDS